MFRFEDPIYLWLLCLIPLTALLWLLSVVARAQREPPATGAEGVAVDVRTGEPIPFAQVVFVGSRIGAMVDTAGHFMVENRQGLVTLSVGFVGYKKGW